MLIFVIYIAKPYKLSLNISIKTCLLDFNNKSHNYFDDTINVQITIIETLRIVEVSVIVLTYSLSPLSTYARFIIFISFCLK